MPIRAKKLTPKQEQFCRIYTDKNSESYWNATKSYLQAYNVPYKIANASWNRMLVNVSIKKRIMELTKVDNRIFDADHELYSVIFQNENLSAKVAGLTLYYKMTGRFKKEKKDNRSDESKERFRRIVAKIWGKKKERDVV
ncbi:MAG: hypothetical protein ACD_3C00070G0001 [uncultured bacterium (gcode 4)]|uniref:Terminase small subunit n=1 Tax=uncultured bacterium (gcode 4) TaxID=1234023 RepID=K2G279_9BACT|nr:MAG: hypothetical protein ACD_3C00070G0001 [uncultured bacterium (gcode 4)]